MADDALIHLRVPATTKARWVRESRAAGMRLTDWIVQRVEPAAGGKAGAVTNEPIEEGRAEDERGGLGLPPGEA